MVDSWDRVLLATSGLFSLLKLNTGVPLVVTRAEVGRLAHVHGPDTVLKPILSKAVLFILGGRESVQESTAQVLLPIVVKFTHVVLRGLRQSCARNIGHPINDVGLEALLILDAVVTHEHYAHILGAAEA
jgi:hypothetical protein